VESASILLTMQRWMLELGEERARAMLASEVARQEADARAWMKAEAGRISERAGHPTC
jgi:hypothetical protein